MSKSSIATEGFARLRLSSTKCHGNGRLLKRRVSLKLALIKFSDILRTGLGQAALGPRTWPTLPCSFWCRLVAGPKLAIHLPDIHHLSSLYLRVLVPSFLTFIPSALLGHPLFLSDLCQRPEHPSVSCLPSYQCTQDPRAAPAKTL